MKVIQTVVFSTLFVFSSAQALDYHKDAIAKFEADAAVQKALNKKESEPAQVAQILSGRVAGGRFHTYVVTQLVDISRDETSVVAATVHYDPSDKATVTVVDIKRLGTPAAAAAAADEIEAFTLDKSVIAQIGSGKTKKPIKLEIATGKDTNGDVEEYLVIQMVQRTTGPAEAPSTAVMAAVHLDAISMSVQLVELVPKKK